MVLVKIKCSLEKKLFQNLKIHTRKSDGNDSGCNSYKISDINFIAAENLAKTCLLFALYSHCVYNNYCVYYCLYHNNFADFPRAKGVSYFDL